VCTNIATSVLGRSVFIGAAAQCVSRVGRVVREPGVWVERIAVMFVALPRAVGTL